ncbi:unnamed protein product [Kuraishia capsulata CBS 1993]|uniref:Uncharacterized protein n=1 Tax=Kuraishia capsulata CBS 1993 TaxID=1382522 RepID=W6MKT2_9ASCO|nr:uncharacterized protein KUCA_T00001341001 [Kuraishia capsulata CBS 1993]CDK25372.1 unnamed protein product [Kuraishia capsulata CBS 1993]
MRLPQLFNWNQDDKQEVNKLTHEVNVLNWHVKHLENMQPMQMPKAQTQPMSDTHYGDALQSMSESSSRRGSDVSTMSIPPPTVDHSIASSPPKTPRKFGPLDEWCVFF